MGRDIEMINFVTNWHLLKLRDEYIWELSDYSNTYYFFLEYEDNYTETELLFLNFVLGK